MFGIGAGNVKKGAERVLKRLREGGSGANIDDWHEPGSKAGRPFKIVRLSDLRDHYLSLE